jgi:pSer/pThr/pTyr-binding forkhead associated (FHA) protein
MISPVVHAPRALQISRAGRVLRVLLLDKDLVKLGRHEACDVRLDDPSICRIHALIMRDYDVDRCRITHYGSTGETLVNGVSITHAPLAEGDEVQIGEYTILLAAQDARRADPTSPPPAERVLVPTNDGALVAAPVAKVLWAATCEEMSIEPSTGEIDVRAGVEPIYLLTRRKSSGPPGP